MTEEVQKVVAQQSVSVDDLKYFELTRAQIEHEDSLIKNRVGWLLSLQAFLFGAFGLTVSAQAILTAAKTRDPSIDLDSLRALIERTRDGLALMAFASSFVLLFGIAAAAASMTRLVDKWSGRDVQHREQFPQIIGQGIGFTGISAGLLPTYLLPVASSLIWLWLQHDEVSLVAAILVMIVAVILVGALYIFHRRELRAQKKKKQQSNNLTSEKEVPGRNPPAT